MQFPALDDTIVAVSTAWHASPLGIVRLSGPESFGWVGTLGIARPRDVASWPTWTAAHVKLGAGEPLPANALWFREPHSYTGQDVVELHTVGCLPLLRELCGRLIALGARRALPGEFTARAFLAGKLNGESVADVLALLHASEVTTARDAARGARTAQRLKADLAERITDLLAAIEAGIDFADEEDVRFISPHEVRAALDEMLGRLTEFRQHPARESRAERPHVALAGRPNAGKSTLFNAWLGQERAIVSPVLGTTRDVLSAEVAVAGLPIVLQDCAGLGESEDDLELAAHRAAERAAEQADLVLWVHAANAAWTEPEVRAAARIPADKRLFVLSKADLDMSGHVPPPRISAETVSVSALTGVGLSAVQQTVYEHLARSAGRERATFLNEPLRGVSTAVERARNLAAGSDEELSSPEMIALELRLAYDLVSRLGSGELVENVLARIYSQFCVGK